MIVERMAETIRGVIQANPAAEAICSAYLFGSIVSEQYGRSSDVDLLVICHDASAVIDALRAVRQLNNQLRRIARVDLNVSFRSEVEEKVIYRPFIYTKIFTYGRLVYGEKIQVKQKTLDPREILESLVFDAREFRRIYVGTDDPQWSTIIQKNVRYYFYLLCELNGIYPPTFQIAMIRAIEFYQWLFQFHRTFEYACFGSGGERKVESVMNTLEILKSFLDMLTNSRRDADFVDQKRGAHE